MDVDEILDRRLRNQLLVSSTLKTAQQVVEWMSAMQAQEYAMAKWAIGLRLPRSNESEIEKAFNDGKILQTHLIRPAWYFVCDTLKNNIRIRKIFRRLELFSRLAG